MRCISPFRVNHPDGLIDMVRCGKCRYCRIRRKMHWIGRLRLEQVVQPKARFLTLTYAEDPGVLQVEDLQKFLKRYRHHYGECRYFAVGEYGTKSGRGHWHLIIFGQLPVTIGPWLDNKAWNHGYSYDGTAGVESMGYVAGYVLKPANGDVRKPVTRMSLRPGIGSEGLARLAYQAAKSGIQAWPTEYRIGGRRYPLIDGGLRIFMNEFLKAGGSPPQVMSPDERHTLAVLQLADWGTRLSDERTAKVHFQRDRGSYRHGTKEEKRGKV